MVRVHVQTLASHLPVMTIAADANEFVIRPLGNERVDASNSLRTLTSNTSSIETYGAIVE